MPGLLHEFIVSLFTDRPSLAVDLYAAADASNLPAYDEVSGGKQSLSQATTAAYDADEVVVLNHGGVPQLALIVEVQLRADEGKRFSWPGYAVSARFKKRCEAIVLVITPSAQVARWARTPIHIGGGNHFRPTVIGPDRIPLLTDPASATVRPELALLSVITHGRSSHALDLAGAAAAVVRTLDEDAYDLYTDMVLAHLDSIAQEVFSQMLKIENFEPLSKQYREAFEAAKAQAEEEGAVQGQAAGRLEARRETLKRQMRLKFQTLSDVHAAFIDAANIDVLDQALERILSAEDAHSVLYG